MPLSADISTALHLLEHIHDRVEDCDDPKLQMHTTQDLKSLISLLEDPVFRSIVTIQDSLIELNTQLGHHPSILPGDFDINISGQLELSVPNTPVQPLGPNIYQDLYQDSSELEDQRVPVAPLVHSSSEDTSAQVTSPSLVSEVLGMPPITTPTYAKEFKKVIEAAAKGRQICTVQLYKPEGTSLGFSVVGLRSKDRGELGIFLQEIQPNGVAGCDGRLVEGDQILAIDGQPLDSNISHEQAISILQKARGLVEIVVARSTQDIGSFLPTDDLSSTVSPAAGGAAVSVIGGVGGGAGTGGSNQAGSDKEQSVSGSSVVNQGPASRTSQPSTASAATPTPTATPTPASTPVPGGLAVERSPSAVSDASKSGSDMVLNTEWAQVEVINLINDGSGLGFGIIGGRSTGVVVKTILPGGVADRDNRLQSGDHILQIGDVNLRGMGSEQVAAVLRQSGTHVRLVVARPVEPTSPDYQALGSHAPIVPTKILGDPDELDRYLVHSVPETYNMRHTQGDTSYDNGYMYSQESDMDMHARSSLIMDVVRNPMPIGTLPAIPPAQTQIPELPVLTMDATIDVNSLPEMERFTVELKKDIYGLGVTIAGYVCEKEDLSGIFVKSISEGSAADLSNKIQINDRIVEVDGHSLQGYSNHEAVEVLRSTGQTVVLCLERYLRGPKYEQLQQAIAASELRLPQPSSPSITSLPSFPISADGETTTEIEPEGESHTTVDSAAFQEVEREKSPDNLEDIANVEALLSDPSSELTPQIRAAIKSKWQKIVGPDTEIVIAQLKKFAEGSGLGISLEGTVDVENGQEVRPHHYIRSILPEGPVGQNGTLRSGDELLEVNGYRLLGINHMEVVSVLKELPIHVRMVCGRNVASQDPLCPIDTAQHQAAFQTRSILGGSLQNLLPTMDRLVKAKSDGSLASTTTTATVTDASLNKMKSRSLEPLTGLAMWSSEPQIIELVKGERGLGFSILDYQDPMNPNETVIVIRSLVPGGVAQVDGQLIPGDRLLFVNDIALENATLDQAVQALKGAPKGTVRIGVAKPLPIPDSIVQQGVTPICIIKRSQSLPNDSETTDRAADLEDFLSSRSGVTDLSTDKQEDEEEDEWKDASPITPVYSPTKPSAPLPSVLEIDDMSSNSESKMPPRPPDLIPAKVSSPLGKIDVPRNMGGPEKKAETVAPKVKLKEEPTEDAEKKIDTAGKEVAERTPESIVAGLSISSVTKAPATRRSSLKRHSSLDFDTKASVAQETSDRSEASSEKGARRKVSGATVEDTARRKSRKKGEHASKRERTRIESTKSTESIEETEEDRDRADLDELQARLKADRKSLKEQECIERVTEFLRRHSLDLGHPGLLANEPEITIPGRPWSDMERVERPSPTYEFEEEICTCNRVFSRPAETTSPRKCDVEREGILDDLEEDAPSSSIKETPSTPMSVKEFVASAKPTIKSTSDESPKEFLLEVTRDETPAENKRPSSLKKKRKEERSSRESSKESLLDETKKEVRIQEDVQEIFFEDASEAIAALLPEVQLVKARIITAEEAAANRFEETKIEVYESFEVKSSAEVAIVLDAEEERNATPPPAISSSEMFDKSQLQLPVLAKSTSENALAGRSEAEEAKVSQRNLKPEILLDLSKMSSSTEEVSAAVDSTPEGKERRSLTRTGSEGSKRFSKAIDQRSFGIKRLAQPAEPELTTLDESRTCEAARARNLTTAERDGEGEKVQDSIPTALRYEVEDAKASEEGRKRPATLKKVPPVDESPDTIPKRTLADDRLGSPRLPVNREEVSGRDSCVASARVADYEKVPCSVRQLQADESRAPVRREEDSLIGKEHSLQYQSQTLETQSDHFGLSSSSLDNLILGGSKSDDWTLPEVSPEHSLLKTERSFKQQTSYSNEEPRRERRDVETQTHQESKSTQCSPEQSTASQADDFTTKCPLHVCQGFYQSPRREVQTQTQGESKSVQCSLEELVEELGFQSKSVVLVDASSESPARSLVQESKSIQCLPQDISPRLKFASEREVFVDSYRSPRKEVEVQTYQESKGIQCSDEELLEVPEEPVQYSQPRVLSLEPSRLKSSASTSRAGGTPKTSPTVVFVKETLDMTVTHRDRDGNVAWTKHWGPERLVKIYREPKTSLGLSIVGGKVDLHNGESSSSQNISGIFIKYVLPNSPAGRTGELKVGDRIIEVDGVDLRQSTHERAVEVIQAAGNPVCLLVQSLVNLQSPENDSRAQDDESDRGSRRPRTPTASIRRKPAQSPTKSPDVMQKSAEEKQSSSRSDFRRQSTRGADGAGPSSRRASMKKSIRKKAPSPPASSEALRAVSEERDEPRPRPARKYSSEESSEEEDTRMLEGNVYTKSGMEISRKSAGNVKRSKEEIEADPEKEDEYGYTARKVQKKYRAMGDPVLLVAIEKDRYGLGISLAGHKDRNRMAVFICGLNPKGSAYKAGTLSVGDEILEVNGMVLQGRCHLNASALIKGMAGTCFKIVVARKSSGMTNLAVKPIVQFPPTIDEADQFSHYKGVHTVPVKKGTYGLGIMIIEGKHAEVGQGIFVSDIQEGSAAEQAGLQVGDLILAVNMDCLLGSTYDQATSLLKKAEGVVRLTVCNPNQSKIGKEDEGGKPAVEVEKAAAPKEPEKPKEPEPPQDPKDCKINVGKDTSIEFQKDKDKAIGFIIAGGSDTPMKAVFILEVFPDGAAGKDGRLQAGDQILDMCQESFKEIEHSKAHAAVLKAAATITMVVHRQENPYEEIEVELQKKSGKGAGLCFTGFKSGKGAYVSDLLPGGSALESGKICKGDRVVAVCGQDVREAPVEDIAFHVKVSNPVQLKLARFKSAKQ